MTWYRPDRVRDSAGTTLIETITALGIMSVGLTLVSSGVFHALSLQDPWREALVTTREARHAGSWFARDAMNATSTDLVDGNGATSSVVLTWPDENGLPRSIEYAQAGSLLTRTGDGDTNVLARRVTNAGFSLSQRTLTFDLTLTDAAGQSTQTVLQTLLRMLST